MAITKYFRIICCPSPNICHKTRLPWTSLHSSFSKQWYQCRRCHLRTSLALIPFGSFSSNCEVNRLPISSFLLAKHLLIFLFQLSSILHHYSIPSASSLVKNHPQKRLSKCVLTFTCSNASSRLSTESRKCPLRTFPPTWTGLQNSCSSGRKPDTLLDHGFQSHPFTLAMIQILHTGRIPCLLLPSLPLLLRLPPNLLLWVAAEISYYWVLFANIYRSPFCHPGENQVR